MSEIKKPLELGQIISGAASVAKSFPVKTITLFGSYADNTATDKSDVDLLVEFETPSVSLLLISQLKIALEDIFGVPVDIIHAPIVDTSLITIGKTVPLYAA